MSNRAEALRESRCCDFDRDVGLSHCRRISRPIERAREHQHPKRTFRNRIFVRAEVGRGGTDNPIAMVLEQRLMPGQEVREALNGAASAERLQHRRYRYAVWKFLKSTERA